MKTLPGELHDDFEEALKEAYLLTSESHRVLSRILTSSHRRILKALALDSDMHKVLRNLTQVKNKLGQRNV